MKLGKLLSVLAAISVLLVGSDSAVTAAVATANLGVGTTVSVNCTITATAVTFPTAYDPVVTNAAPTANSDGTGNIAVTCTKGAGLSIALNTGLNPSGAPVTPRMKGPGAADFLSYSLYSDAGRSTDWCGVTRGISPALSKATQNFVVYARIPGGQDVSTGTYADTVVATLNY